VESNKTLFRVQGRLRQLRDIENLLPAVKEWIVQYEKQDELENVKLRTKLKGVR